MKIVFVQPNVGFKGHTWEALGIGYIAAKLRKDYPDLEIDFYSGFYDKDEQILKASRDADIIGFGCTSPQFKHGLELAKKIKTDKNVIVFGGVHPSALPDQVLKEESIDAIVIGEGELAMSRLVKEVKEGKKVRKRLFTPEIIEDLDGLPFPDRKIIKNERNIQQAMGDEGIRITSVLSSRGCPFGCTFCSSHILWGRHIRIRTPENIIDEIEGLVNDWNIQFLKFADDTFTVNKERTLEFCRLKMERGIKLPYGANAHVNTMDREVMKQLAASGCQELWYGVESGSGRILKEMHKHTDVDRIKKVFKLTREFGIKTRAYFLLGMPTETVEDIAMTEKLCDELRPDIVGFTLLSPFPCNEYYDPAAMADWDWSTFDEYSNDWVKTASISNRELKEIQHRLVAKYQQAAAFRQRKNGTGAKSKG
jgi:anaerobic magnesium-protoporphyrin IX monomethyl ester cyclase